MDKQVIKGICPSKSNSYKIIKIKGSYSLGKKEELANYEKSFILQCNLYRNKNITGYFEFYMDVYYPNQRSDLDNSLKVVLDCLQKCNAIKNDNKCVKIVLRKFWDKINPRVEFIIIPVDFKA